MRYARVLIAVAAVLAVVVLGLVFRGPPRASLRDGIETPAAQEIVHEVPRGSQRAAARDIAALASADRKDPRTVARATAIARQSIDLSRRTGDPRHLGHAEAALAPFASDPEPPGEVLVLRATIRQSLHDFDGALGDLDRVVARTPDDGQAWLTRAVILTVKGEHARADESCARVEKLAPPLVHAVCHGTVLSLTGRAAEARDRLEAVLRESTAGSEGESAWALSSLAEYKLRLGDAVGAERAFQEALAASPDDAWVKAALADLLLDGGRPREVLSLLDADQANDGLLLRHVIAMTRLRLTGAENRVKALGERHDASRLRGDTVHRREEARYWLEVAGDPRKALELAVANWEVQREPADLRVLLEAALARKDRAAAAKGLAFLRATKLEDPAIQRAAKGLEP